MANDQVRREVASDGENGTCFVVTKPFRPDQLMAELTTAMNWRKDSGASMDGDAASASPDSPVFVWVEREDVDGGVFEGVVRDHQPDPAWRAKPTEEATIEDVCAKAARGEFLTPEDQQVALRALLSASG